MLIKCCFCTNRAGYCWAELAQAGITRAEIVTGGKTPAGKSPDTSNTPACTCNVHVNNIIFS